MINSGTCFRTPEAVLELWRTRYGLELDVETMRPHFERVERVLSVAEVTPELAGINAEVARRGAERLGWSHGYLRRNAKGCVGSGVCVFGCPTSAKQHTGLTYVPQARAAGAQVVPQADAKRILTSGRRATGVEAIVAGSGPVRVDAPIVVVAAGTIHTPGLLARSGLGAGSGQLGHNLSLHPCSAVVALMDDVVDMARGVPQSFYVDEFARQGIMLEGVAGPPAYVAMSLPLSGSRHAEVMAQYRHLATFGVMVSDSSRGHVGSLLGQPVIRYSLNGTDLNRFRVGLARTRELYEAAGAREVFLPLPPGVAPEHARARDLKLMAFHPLGTARADARPQAGVVSGDLELHGTRGVYVADGSVVPSALGVNPQLTIMALATRLAATLLARAGTGLAPEPGSGALAGQ
jgi:choline dehydrogenase-like flavoprotein